MGAAMTDVKKSFKKTLKKENEYLVDAMVEGVDGVVEARVDDLRGLSSK